jgi:6-phosphogluconolactonase (cycloisomerase 2 family)
MPKIKAISGDSRRNFVQSAAGFLAAAPLFARARQTTDSSHGGPALAYVGTYSSPQGPEGSKGRGRGIYLFEMNRATGALSHRALFENDSNPAWLAIAPSRAHLYSANETPTYKGASSGSVSAYSIDHSNGGLKLLNTVASGGAGPAYVSVHPAGKHVLAANYAGGTVAVLPIRANGELGDATDIKHDRGPVGPAHAASAPPGSFAISGHDSPHAHTIEADPSGRFVISTDLGTDRILVWKFDSERGTLTPNDPAFVSVPPGDGPRHIVFHPNRRWLYSLQEEASTLIAFDYDGASGKLTRKQTISSLPKGFAGTNFTSEVRISSDGRFLYAGNRLHDTIAFFSIDAAGKLTFVGEEWTRGDYPRSFTIDPTGNFLYCCNQRSDAVTTFRVNRQTGRLTFTGQYTPVGTPAIVVFLS